MKRERCEEKTGPLLPATG
uniref:Uncharacterized protein n=1 Tax=Anguilla anguilla TaxID=7936 RepID=A0A0E9TLS9_ANGAN